MSAALLAPSKSHTYTTLLGALLPPTNAIPLLPPRNRPSPSLTSSIASLQLHPTLEALLHILNTDLTSAHFLVRHMQSPPKHEGMLLHAILHRVEGDIENARAWYGDVAGSGSFEFAWAAKEDEATDEALQAAVEAAEQHEEEQKKEEQEQKDQEEDDQKDKTASPRDHNPPTPGSTPARNTSPALPSASTFLDDLAKLRASQNKSHSTPAWKTEHSRLAAISEREIRRVLAWCARRFGTGRWEDASGEFVGSTGKHKEIAEKMLVGGEGWRVF